MAVAQLSPIVRHAERAKKLLAALQQHGDATAKLVGGETPAEFFAALEERERLLDELNNVIEAMTRERLGMGRERQAQIALIQDVLQTATAAMASQNELVGRVQRERNRLADAVERSSKPDTVAHQYSGYGMRVSAGLSVTG
jgi:hypothetical protein